MDLDDQIAEDWRALGFWYHCEPETGWEIRGASDGVLRLVSALRTYVADPRNAAPGEHEHHGPYRYLKVTTSTFAAVTEHQIEGTLRDIARFADLLEARLRGAAVGDRFDLSRKYSQRSTVPFVVRVEAPGFDPASLDPDRGRWPPRATTPS